MLAVGSTLEVARAVAIASALIAAVVLYLGARLLGCSRLLATVGVLAAASLPTATRLAPATVPEYPSAALLAFAMCSASAPSNLPQRDLGSWLRWPPLWGSLAVALATACRYEAWPVAIAFAGYVLVRFVERARVLPAHTPSGDLRAPLVAATGATTFICLWLLHGWYWHDDALFFVRRVVDYKRALGTGETSLGLVLAKGPPGLLFFQEPSVWFLLGLSALALVRRRSPQVNQGKARPSPLPLLVLPLALLLTLTWGELRGGAPTHHAGRPLLSIWLLLPLVSARLLDAVRGIPPWAQALALALIQGTSQMVTRPLRPPLDGFAQRHPEEALGRRIARDFPAAAVVVATPDYGYLAIQASAGSPERFVVVDRHDPRDRKDPMTDQSGPSPVLALAKSHGAPLIVAPRSWRLDGFERISGEGDLALFERVPARSPR